MQLIMQKTKLHANSPLMQEQYTIVFCHLTCVYCHSYVCFCTPSAMSHVPSDVCWLCYPVSMAVCRLLVLTPVHLHQTPRGLGPCSDHCIITQGCAGSCAYAHVHGVICVTDQLDVEHYQCSAVEAPYGWSTARPAPDAPQPIGVLQQHSPCII